MLDKLAQAWVDAMNEHPIISTVGTSTLIILAVVLCVMTLIIPIVTKVFFTVVVGFSVVSAVILIYSVIKNMIRSE